MGLPVTSDCGILHDKDVLDAFLCLLQPQPTAVLESASVPKSSLGPPVLEKTDGAALKPEKIYRFQEQLKEGDIAETCFLRFAERWKRKGVIREVLDVRENPQYRRLDIDFICVMPDGTSKTYEVKGDQKKTGNVFAEYAVPSYRLNENKEIIQRDTRLGWLYGSQADYIFYHFVNMDIVCLLSLNRFAAWVDAMSLQCNFVRRRQKTAFQIRGAKNIEEKNNPNGSYYYGLGYLVPLKEIEQAMESLPPNERFLKIYHLKGKPNNETKK